MITFSTSTKQDVFSSGAEGKTISHKNHTITRTTTRNLYHWKAKQLENTNTIKRKPEFTIQRRYQRKKRKTLTENTVKPRKYCSRTRI